MTFVGNSPVKFKKPMNSENLSKELKKNDIFITASQIHLLRHCGLPAIGLDDGGHTEIISKAGEVFNEKEEIIKILEKIVENYEKYQQNINLQSLYDIGKRYNQFLGKIYHAQQYESKSFNLFNQLILEQTLLLWKISEKLDSF